MPKAKAEPDVARYADMFSAMGTEPRLRIMQLFERIFYIPRSEFE